jgi:hypothetical protein
MVPKPIKPAKLLDIETDRRAGPVAVIAAPGAEGLICAPVSRSVWRSQRIIAMATALNRATRSRTARTEMP